VRVSESGELVTPLRVVALVALAHSDRLVGGLSDRVVLLTARKSENASPVLSEDQELQVAAIVSSTEILHDSKTALATPVGVSPNERADRRRVTAVGVRSVGSDHPNGGCRNNDEHHYEPDELRSEARSVGWAILHPCIMSALASYRHAADRAIATLEVPQNAGLTSYFSVSARGAT
jgi:hypothetical protein